MGIEAPTRQVNKYGRYQVLANFSQWIGCERGNEYLCKYVYLFFWCMCACVWVATADVVNYSLYSAHIVIGRKAEYLAPQVLGIS